MKRFSAVFPMLLCLAAGVARWLDLANWTDLASGFSAVGPYWLRYAALAALLAVFALCSLAVPRTPDTLVWGSLPCGLLSFLCGILFSALGGYTLARFPTEGLSVIEMALAVLFLFTAVWMFIAGLSRFGEEASAPAGPMVFGILGTLSFLLLAFQQGLSQAANLERITVVWHALGCVCALWFSVRLLRACYLPATRVGRGCYIAGYAVFLMNTCLLLPQSVCLYLAGPGSFYGLLESIAMGALGLLGLAFAILCAAGEDITEPDD